MYFTDQLEENMTWLNQALHVDKNFDVVYRVLTIADKKACLYFIDGFTKDDSLLKILQGFSSIKPDDMPEDAHRFSKKYLPYGEIGLLSDSREMIIQLFLVFPVFLLMVTTNVLPLTAVPILQEVSVNRKKTRLCAVPEMVL